MEMSEFVKPSKIRGVFQFLRGCLGLHSQPQAAPQNFSRNTPMKKLQFDFLRG